MFRIASRVADVLLVVLVPASSRSRAAARRPAVRVDPLIIAAVRWGPSIPLVPSCSSAEVAPATVRAGDVITIRADNGAVFTTASSRSSIRPTRSASHQG